MRKFIQFALLIFFICAEIQSTAQIDSLQNIIITVNFAAPPTSFSVSKAPLRFNKKFAYSFQIDDGGKDIYSHGFPFFMGGTVAGTTYPGLKYTDGCGNDHNFKMSSSMFSFSYYGGNEVDMHDPSGAYATLNITWPEIGVMLQNNWGISNHGLTSSTSENMDYEIARNHSYVKLKTSTYLPGGDNMGVFVNPNGSESYTAPAFAQGYLACYRVGYTFGDPSFDVTSTWDHNQIKMGRSAVGTGVNLTALVDAIASASTGSAHHWGVHFTHSITNASWGYDFSTFSAALSQVASTYGKSGLDNIWMTTEEEVIDYLLVKDAINVNTELTGSVLKITYSGTIPSTYRYYSNSLLVNADQPITSVSASGITNFTYNGTGTNNSLINLTWNGHYEIPPEVTAETWVSKAENTHSQYDANVAMDYVLLVPAGATQQAFRLRLCTITGVTLPASFCNMRNAPIGSIPILNVCPNTQFNIPILVSGFTNITSARLRIEFDSLAFSFLSGAAAKPSVISGMTFTSSPVGSGSPLKKILIEWSSATPKSLSASDTLAILTFQNASGPSPVTFNTEVSEGGDCEYKDENGNVMIDFPASTYFINGQVNFLGLPAPGAITGPSAICPGTGGHIYSAPAVPGATGYSWTYPEGFTPTSGQNTNSITLEATAASVSGDIDIRAINVCNENPASPPFPVTVKPRPVPTVNGDDSLCVITTNVAYSTEPGMVDYSWAVSSGGTITHGWGTNTISVAWSYAGTQSVSVWYEGESGCTATAPGVATVSVNPRPLPTITGSSSGCLNGTAVYSTDSGMSDYTWSVSPGGVILSGGNTQTVTIQWNAAGSQSVSVNWTNAYGCAAIIPVVKTVSVVFPPAPVIAGMNQVCAGSANLLYSTEAGMSDYQWQISSGGSITGGSGTNAITVTWKIPGQDTIWVNYTNPSGCSAPIPSVKLIVVHSLPVPTVSGDTSVCSDSQDATYSTEPGMSNYQWSITSDGTITSGGNTNVVTAHWSGQGLQGIGVNYTAPNGCSGATPANLDVRVKPAPVPTISGVDSVCRFSTAYYATDTGMSNYLWNVGPGGTIVSGQGTHLVAVHWTDSGNWDLSVNYTNSDGCSAAVPTSRSILVFPLPVPAIAGLQQVCKGSSGIIYSTEQGMNNYLWTISEGGIINSGGTTNMITVTWNEAGMQWVGVNYTNAQGCEAASPVIKNVEVLASIVPSITGYDTVCVNQLAGYHTEEGMSNYQWTISEGGTIISGLGTSLIQVLWTGEGTRYLTVNYVDPSGCQVGMPGSKSVVVAHITPVISGDVGVCTGASGVVYSTQPGMVNYSWSVTQGGIITSGYGTHTILVDWIGPGIQAVGVNYSNLFGCTAPVPSTLTVTVNPLPVPTVTGNTQLCMNSGQNPYLTQQGMTNYNWSLSSGGSIISGQGTHAIVVDWNTPGSHEVMVSYASSSGCLPADPGTLTVTVGSLPGSPGQVSGETLICKPENGVVYSIAPIPFATGYLWNLPPGVVITNGANTHAITVNFSSNAESGEISAAGINSCGPGSFSPPLLVSVYPHPPTPVISLIPPDTLVSSASTGNQWYFENQPIAGSTGQRHLVSQSGHYFVLVNPYGCSSQPSNIINVIAVGTGEKPSFDIGLYPNPSNGKFTLHLNTSWVQKELSVRVIDFTGKVIFALPEQAVSGEVKQEIDLGHRPAGIYSVIIRFGNDQTTRKMMIEK